MATQNIFNLTDTWNNVATTFTAIKMNVTDTASAAGSLLIDLQTGGTSQFSISKTGGVTGLSNVLEVRNGTTAQTLRVYNTYTDASNYERGSLVWGSNIVSLIQESAGTGSARQFKIGTAGNSALTARTNGTDRWSFMPSGHIFAEADNTYDLGASGSNRPRNLYMASWIGMAVTTVAALPAAATAGAGARMMVSDALAPVFGSAVAGSGAETVPVYSTGAAWNVG